MGLGLRLAHFPKAIVMEQLLHSCAVLPLPLPLLHLHSPLSGKCMRTERIGYLVLSCNAANDITVFTPANLSPKSENAPKPKRMCLPFPFPIKTELGSSSPPFRDMHVGF